MLLKLIPAALIAVASWANVINDVREAADQKNFALGDSIVQKYRSTQGTTPEAMVAMATVPLASFTAGQGPATLKALDSLVSFIGDWKQPKGPIKIAIKPAKSASVADLDKVMEPNALTDIFGLTVDYAGTRAGAVLLAALRGDDPVPAALVPVSTTRVRRRAVELESRR